MRKDYYKFIIPSILGILILMFPFTYEGQTTIFVSILSKKLLVQIESYVTYLILFLVILSGLVSLITKIFKPQIILRSEYLNQLFNLNYFWLIVRVISMLFAVFIIYSIGPEQIISENTGGLVMFDLIPTLVCVFLFASILLPLLTEFGLLEYVGVMMRKVMRPIFNLPGRSSVDCVASWIGDGTIGVTLTNKQYEMGYYTEKEAAIISTTFSAVSITFSLVVLNQVKLTQYFGIYYLTIILCGLACAIICPRIYPLRNKKDVYYNNQNNINDEEENTADKSIREYALDLAIKKANSSWNLKEFVIKGIKTILEMWIAVIPTILCFGTIGLILSEYTSIFTILGYPFKYLYELLNIPNADVASKAVMVGFSDMFIPSVIATATPISDMTRFIVATLSVTQLIYLSETGAVILGTKIPVNLFELFIIYVERTLISIPIIVIIAKIIF